MRNSHPLAREGRTINCHLSYDRWSYQVIPLYNTRTFVHKYINEVNNNEGNKIYKFKCSYTYSNYTPLVSCYAHLTILLHYYHILSNNKNAICMNESQVIGPLASILCSIQRIFCLFSQIYGTGKLSARVIQMTRRYETLMYSWDILFYSGWYCIFSTRDVLMWVFDILIS